LLADEHLHLPRWTRFEGETKRLPERLPAPRVDRASSKSEEVSSDGLGVSDYGGVRRGRLMPIRQPRSRALEVVRRV
jgi:hypothetical protein